MFINFLTLTRKKYKYAQPYRSVATLHKTIIWILIKDNFNQIDS